MTDLKERKKITDGRLCLILYFLVFAMMAVLGGFLSVSYILDETGTVANAAYLAGYNWNDWVNSTGGYFYKYGQALFYGPILALVKNPYLIYKLMMLVNGALYSFIPVCAYKLLRDHLSQEDKIKCALMAFLVSVIPAPLIYSLFARGDVMLIILSWVVLLMLLNAVNADTKKRSCIYSALTAFFSVYAYMCHSRGIVFVIAIVIIVAYLWLILKERKLSIISFMISMVLSLFLDKKLTSFFKNNIWGEGAKKNTLGSIGGSRFDGMFTGDGIKTLSRSTCGWMLSTFTGTFGLAILGLIIALVLTILFLVKNKDKPLNEKVVGIYGFLMYCGTLAMGILFMFRSNYKFVTGLKVKRADRFIYSRYLSPTYAVLVFIALFYVFFKLDMFGIKTRLISLVVGASFILYCRTWLGPYTKRIEYSWRNTIDLGIFFNTREYGNDANEYVGISRAVLLMAVMSFVVLVIIMVLGKLWKNKDSKILLSAVIIGFLAVSARSYYLFRFTTDIRPLTTVAAAINMMDYIQDRTDIPEEFSDVYIDKSVSRFKLMQIALPRFTVHVRSSVKAEDVDNMFIIAKNRKLNEAWQGDDCYLLKEYCDSDEQTMVIVKGGRLRKLLDDRGIELVKIPEGYGDVPVEKNKLWLRRDIGIVWGYEWDSMFPAK